MLVKLFLLSVFCGLQNVAAQLDEGDACRTPGGMAGKCKFVTDCPSSLKAILKGEVPKRCGFDSEREVICCPYGNSPILENFVDSSTTELTRSTTEEDRKYPVGAIFSEKCDEYTKLAYPEVNTKNGGLFVSVEDFAHMVRIGYGSENNITWGCGGSIISEYFVLTAASCLKDSHLGRAVFVRGGAHQEIIIHGQLREIAELIPHPNFSKKYHDIGLIRVNKQFNFNQWVRPACLFAVDNLTSIHLWVTGWGQTEYADASRELMKARYQEYPIERCYQTNPNDTRTSLRIGMEKDFIICAGSPQHSANTCRGDSGGPLQYKWNTNKEPIFMYNIVGVIPFRVPCAKLSDIPEKITKVSAYIEWIEDIVWSSELQ